MYDYNELLTTKLGLFHCKADANIKHFFKKVFMGPYAGIICIVRNPCSV